jgi:hypothetical protein
VRLGPSITSYFSLSLSPSDSVFISLIGYQVPLGPSITSYFILFHKKRHGECKKKKKRERGRIIYIRLRSHEHVFLSLSILISISSAPPSYSVHYDV